jgi:AcrR family transcriptional regulator
LTRKEIIDAAFRVWGRNFYRKTSLSQLAGELGVSKPALYRHFENKQALTAAMTKRFFDDFAGSIHAEFERARQAKDVDEGIFTIVKSISAFLARDVYALIFSLINVFDRNLKGRYIVECLKERDVDIGTLNGLIEKKYTNYPIIVHFIFASIIFFMSYFHRAGNTVEKPPNEKEIQNIISIVCGIIEHGLSFSAEKAALDFEKLEKKVEAMTLETEVEPLFKAIAEAIAEAGPWDVSMDMVARRLGLSKSSLYGHFKNKKDMLRRLFSSEFRKIINFARQGIALSEIPVEQLYLGIFSINVYFRSHHEFLVALGWIRTRKLDLGRPERKTDIFRLFEDVDIESIRGDEDEKQRASHWILFLLINILTRPAANGNKRHAGFPEGVNNNDIRLLLRFITLGLGGFIR